MGYKVSTGNLDAFKAAAENAQFGRTAGDTVELLKKAADGEAIDLTFDDKKSLRSKVTYFYVVAKKLGISDKVQIVSKARELLVMIGPRQKTLGKSPKSKAPAKKGK